MFKHYIMTRFNLLDDLIDIYNNPAVKFPHAWMNHRMELFFSLTYPSVMDQTEKDFIWLISVSPRTPSIFKKQLEVTKGLKVIYDYPRTWLRKKYSKKSEWIITTRLDNDDIILPEFIESVQDQFNNEFLIVDTDGYQLDLSTGKHYDPARKFNNSPFISLIEKTGEVYHSLDKKTIIDEPVKTAMYCSHTKMIWHFPSMKVQKRLYKMVIHDRNISNKIVGKEIK